MKNSLLIILVALTAVSVYSQGKKPFRIGIAGLTHTHVHWLLARAHDGDIEIVGIAEPNKELAARFLKQHSLPLTLLYPTLQEMIEKSKPQAVAAFNSIYQHLEVVELCAPRGIHVMVEKPLAVSLTHAKKMEALAKKYKIHLLTNYETTWYGSNLRLVDMLDSIGPIRKIVVHDGHQGPKEIGVNKEFLEWLTDPKLNGGGAITDFGCYGANLSTWLMKGERPVSIIAVTQQMKPEIYPRVDDEATIIVTYPKTQTIIQASWNWPYNRKDIEVYGTNGYVIADRNGVRIKPSQESAESAEQTGSPKSPYHDPFAYLAAIVAGEIIVKPEDLSSLENNMIVMEILEAAKRSAAEGKRVYLPRPGSD